MDATKLEIGPCNVYLWEGSPLAAVNVGYTNDGVEVSITPESAELTGSQAGTTPLDMVVTGIRAQISVAFKEIVLENFVRAISNAVGFVDSVTPTKRLMEVRPRAGLAMRTLAKKMEIRPLIGGVETTDVEKIIVAPLAAPAPETISLVYSVTDQRMINAVFYLFPDTDNDDRLLYMGDETVAKETADDIIVMP